MQVTPRMRLVFFRFIVVHTRFLARVKILLGASSCVSTRVTRSSKKKEKADSGRRCLIYLSIFFSFL